MEETEQYENPADSEPIKIYRLTLRLPDGKVVHETVDRYQYTSTELFNALCSAMAQKFDATVLDIKAVD